METETNRRATITWRGQRITAPSVGAAAVLLLRLLRVLGFLVLFLLLSSVVATANGSRVELFGSSIVPGDLKSSSRVEELSGRQDCKVARFPIDVPAALVNNACTSRTTAGMAAPATLWRPASKNSSLQLYQSPSGGF
jgi:hypothetical protein